MEEWRWIPSYEGIYEVSDLGRVRSWHTHARGGPPPRILKSHKSSGYEAVCLCVNDLRLTKRVHVLVASVFIGDRPDEAQTIRHLDGDRRNNRASNLAYGTVTENNRDMITHGTHANANKTHCKRGHEFTAENTYLRPGYKNRNCRTCQIDRRPTWSQRVARRRIGNGDVLG